MSEPRRRILKDVQGWIEYAAFLPLNLIARSLSFRSASRLGWLLGGFFYRRFGIRKKITLDNLEHAFPELSPAERNRIAEGAFRGYIRSLVEGLWTGGATADEVRATTILRNPEVAREALARGKGLILMTGHFGQWEFVVSALPLNLGFPVIAVAQPQRNKHIDAIVTANRSRFGSGTVTMRQSVRDVYQLLRNGKAIGMLGDQSGPKESVFVDFFGRPAATHRGAASFSLKAGSPIVMFFLVRLPDGRYEGHFEEVSREGLTGTDDEKVLELTRRHTSVLERMIRLYPDHWLWMHKRWKHTEYFLEKQHQDIPKA
jgi:Kdo2-lipid IVA lauroyltransferase/acyltransferase